RKQRKEGTRRLQTNEEARGIPGNPRAFRRFHGAVERTISRTMTHRNKSARRRTRLPSPHSCRRGSMPTLPTPKAVVDFWREAGPEGWVGRRTAVVDRCRERVLAAHMAAGRRELDHWMDSAEGALALMVLLDQFPRNCFRGTAHMFATDALAL